ncbi:hypothetical protein G9274_002534 [Stenotrophomonas rhizophila]|nr:hypothetical protein G9274_002534 [Stenotrophomonas rhizophila]
MANQPIDTTTNHGSYTGDPAPTAFGKVNANFAELYYLTSSLTLTAGNYFSGGWIATGAGATVAWDDRTEGAASRWFSFVSGGIFQLYYAPTGALPMYVTRTGVVTATSFNPTSSADVKDYLEGYAGDADAELDRLVVVSYRYRPEFADINKTFVGLLSENVHDVHPDATDGGTETVIQVGEGEGAEEVVKQLPRNVDMMQILALAVRAHQQKSRRIRLLEQRLAAIEALVTPPPAASQ